LTFPAHRQRASPEVSGALFFFKTRGFTFPEFSPPIERPPTFAKWGFSSGENSVLCFWGEFISERALFGYGKISPLLCGPPADADDFFKKADKEISPCGERYRFLSFPLSVPITKRTSFFPVTAVALSRSARSSLFSRTTSPSRNPLPLSMLSSCRRIPPFPFPPDPLPPAVIIHLLFREGVFPLSMAVPFFITSPEKSWKKYPSEKFPIVGI